MTKLLLPEELCLVHPCCLCGKLVKWAYNYGAVNKGLRLHDSINNETRALHVCRIDPSPCVVPIAILTVDDLMPGEGCIPLPDAVVTPEQMEILDEHGSDSCSDHSLPN